MGRLISVLLSLPLLCAAEVRVGEPFLGYVFDSSVGAVRKLVGVPGAAAITEVVTTNAFVEALPGPTGAVVWSSEGDAAFVKADGRITPLSRIEGAALSPSATALAAWSEQLIIWTGLAASPAVSRRIDLPRRPAVVAVSDSGRQAAISSSAGLELFDEGAVRIVDDREYTALAFESGGSRLLAATGEELLLFEETGPRRLADFRAMAVAFTRDGRRALAVAADGALLMVEVSTLESTGLNCRCTPTALFRLRGDEVFALSASVKGLHILDGGATPPRLVAVDGAGE